MWATEKGGGQSFSNRDKVLQPRELLPAGTPGQRIYVLHFFHLDAIKVKMYLENVSLICHCALTHFQLASKRVCVSLGREGRCSRVFCVFVFVCVLGILCLFDCVCLYVCVFFLHCFTHFQLTSKRVCVSLGMCSWNCQSQAARFHFEYLPGEILYLLLVRWNNIYSSSCPVKYFLVLLAV